MAAHGQNRRRIFGLDMQARSATGRIPGARRSTCMPPGPKPDDRIVHRADDRAIVRQAARRQWPRAEQWRPRWQSPSVPRKDCRWCKRSAARRPPSADGAAAIRQHDAEIGIAGGHAVNDRRADVRTHAPVSLDPARRGNNTIGAWCEASILASSSASWQHCRTSSTEGSIKAKGRSGRCLRWRSRVTAAALVASTSN